MASILADWAIDNGLNGVHTNADKIYLCSQDPTTFTEATSTYALGNYNFGAGNAFGAPADATPSGRKITSAVVTAGSITGNGTAVKWAVVDSVNLRLLANGSLASSVGVTSGQAFTLPAFDIILPAY